MLLALMDGRALTASELAAQAGVTKQTASAHLDKLIDGELISREVQGRHHYFKLYDHDVAHVIEGLMGVSAARSGKRIHTGPKMPALRYARKCYDHLAGEVGVTMLERMCAKKWISADGKTLSVTDRGAQCFEDFGIDIKALSSRKRPLCYGCLDWSQRRYHMRGSLAQAVLDQLFERRWSKLEDNTRIIQFSKNGKLQFLQWLE